MFSRFAMDSTSIAPNIGTAMTHNRAQTIEMLREFAAESETMVIVSEDDFGKDEEDLIAGKLPVVITRCPLKWRGIENCIAQQSAAHKRTHWLGREGKRRPCYGLGLRSYAIGFVVWGLGL